MEWIQKWDLILFRWINHKFAGEFPELDGFMVFITNWQNEDWAKYVIGAVLLCWLASKRIQAAKAIIVIALTIFISDSLGYRVLKKTIARPRPNHVMEVQAVVRLPHRPTSYSFPSNHALTSFAVVGVLSYYHPAVYATGIAVASLISFSRIYVGVHYPSDVIGGAIIGWVVAMLIVYGVVGQVKWLKRPSPPKKRPSRFGRRAVSGRPTRAARKSTT